MTIAILTSATPILDELVYVKKKSLCRLFSNSHWYHNHLWRNEGNTPFSFFFLFPFLCFTTQIVEKREKQTTFLTQPSHHILCHSEYPSPNTQRALCIN